MCSGCKNELLSRKNELSVSEMMELLDLEVVQYETSIFFLLPDESVTIEQVASYVPGLTVIGSVGRTHVVLVEANDRSLGRFVELYGDLPDPSAEELSALERILEEKGEVTEMDMDGAIDKIQSKLNSLISEQQ